MESLQGSLSLRCESSKAAPEGFFLPGGEPKFGVTTPRQAGNAVQRNRAKRIMREIYRQNRNLFPTEGALLYLLKQPAERDELFDEMIALAKKVGHKAKQSALKETDKP